MTRDEACNILGLSSSATEDEVKKAFRKQAATNHPDINKEPGAEEKFKSINQAYRILTGAEQSSDQQMSGNPFYQDQMNDVINDFFMNNFAGFRNNPFVDFVDPHSARKNRINLDTLQVNVKLSFEESVLGCTSKISYNIKKYCEQCEATGLSKDNKKKCTICKGTGVITNTIKTGFVIRTTQNTCNTCQGSGLIGDKCSNCNGFGHIIDNISVQLVIPPIGDKEINLVAQRGNVYGSKQGKVIYHIQPTIDGTGKFEGYKIEGRDVISRKEIPLHTLLFGGKVEIKTVHGTTEIETPSSTKIGEQIISKNLGVAGKENSPGFTQGNHRTIIELKYPDKTKLNDDIKDILTKLYEENGETKNI